VKLYEPVHIPDTFVSGLSHVEIASEGNLRFVCYSLRQTACRTKTIRVVAARLVWPVDTLDDGITKTLNARPDRSGRLATRFLLTNLH